MLLIITFNIITYVILHLKLLLFSIHNTGLFEMIVGVLTTCHIQYTRDRSVFFLLNITTLPVSVTHLTDALYVHPL